VVKRIVKEGWPADGGEKEAPPEDSGANKRRGAIGYLGDEDEEPALPKKNSAAGPAEKDGRRVKVSVYLPTELDRKLRYRSVDDRVTISAIVEAALEDYL